MIQNYLVGPGKSASNQLYYLTYSYINSKFDFIAIDPNTGHDQVFPSPVSTEQAAWGLTSGPDNNIYIGTLPHAHLLKFNTTSQQLTDLGQVPPDPVTLTYQSYIWQLTVSSHNNVIYGCTYPSADLISYNPLAVHPQIVNLGTLDPTRKEQYVRSCVADPNPQSPYIYLGLGSVSAQLAAYNTDTHTIAFRISGSTTGFGSVYTALDGSIHATLGSGSVSQYYTLSNSEYAQSEYVQAAPTNVLNDGSSISVSNTVITVTYAGQIRRTYPYTYNGKALSIFRLGLGPDGKVYGGTVSPYHLFAFNPNSAADGVKTYGKFGDGEPYSLLSYNNLLYIAGYYSPNLQIYNPSIPFNMVQNPSHIQSANVQIDLRPQALIGAPNNHLYIGAIASYGMLTGPLITWNTQDNTDIEAFFPIANQSIASLTTTTSRCQDSSENYCIIGGTSIYGGAGSTPSTSSAQLFSWNPATNTVVHQYTIPHVSHPDRITDLITNPANGYVYGIATSSNGSYVFVFNPGTGRFINAGTKLPFSNLIYNSVDIYEGNIWGIASQGVFKINMSNLQTTLIASRNPITAGFAMNGNTLYFASYSDLWSYTIS